MLGQFIAKAFLEKDYENVTARRLAPKPEPEPAPVNASAPSPTEDIAMLEEAVPTAGEQVQETVEKTELTEKPIKTEPAAMSEPRPWCSVPGRSNACNNEPSSK